MVSCTFSVPNNRTRYVKYGPGHEKHPSWPMPAAATGGAGIGNGAANAAATPLAPQSQRTKSWTEHTDYPKEPAASYARPYSKRRDAVYSQQVPGERFLPLSPGFTGFFIHLFFCLGPINGSSE